MSFNFSITDKSDLCIFALLLSISFNTTANTRVSLPRIDQCGSNAEQNIIQKISCDDNLSIVLSEIVFRKNSASISPAARDFLDTLLDPLAKYANVVFEIAAYTDSLGPRRWNQRLSQERADTVRLYLIFRGARASQLVAIGYGEKDPIADNGSKKGRQNNRRIALRLKKTLTANK